MMVLANLSRQRFVRGAILAIAGSAVLIEGIYTALGTSGGPVALGRLVIILLTCVLVWLRRGWARWLLALFGLGAFLSLGRLLAAAPALSVYGYVLALAQALTVVGVLALFTRRARPYFMRTASQVDNGSAQRPS